MKYLEIEKGSNEIIQVSNDQIMPRSSYYFVEAVKDSYEVYPSISLYNGHEDEPGGFNDPDLFEAARSNKWAQVRKQRNELLAETDWTRLDDVTITAEEKTAWEEYRQALRDVTNDIENPFAVVWPDKPV